MSHFASIVGNDGTISVFTEGKSMVFSSDHPKMEDVKDALASRDVEKLEELSRPAVMVENYLKNDKTSTVELKDGVVYWNNEPQHDTCTERIVRLAQESLPIEPMLRFMERRNLNPSMTSKNELWDFLSNQGLPIDDEGFVICFRKVRSDFKDFYTGTVDNSVGSKPTMDRSQVDDERTRNCSKGYHVAALTYARDQYHPGQGIIVVCRVDPKDFVSIPTDHSCQKARVTSYEVLSIYQNEEVSNDYWADYDIKEEDLLDDEDYDNDVEEEFV